MHHEYHEFNGVHVYLWSIRISLHCSMTFMCVISPLLSLLYYFSMITLPSITMLQYVVNKPQSEIIYCSHIWGLWDQIPSAYIIDLCMICLRGYYHVLKQTIWLQLTLILNGPRSAGIQTRDRRSTTELTRRYWLSQKPLKRLKSL